MAERRVRDHQRLHRRRILLHDVADARIGVDDDLIGEALHAGAIHRLVAGEVLAERPVLVEQRHADRGIGIQHLLGADHLDLVGIDVEAELADARSLRSRHARAGWCRIPSRRPRTADARPHARSISFMRLSAPAGASFRRTVRGTPDRCRAGGSTLRIAIGAPVLADRRVGLPQIAVAPDEAGREVLGIAADFEIGVVLADRQNALGQQRGGLVVVGRRVVAVRRLRGVDVPGIRAVALGDDPLHFLERGGHHRAAGFRRVEECIFIHFRRLMRVADEHHIDVLVAALRKM